MKRGRLQLKRLETHSDIKLNSFGIYVLIICLFGWALILESIDG
jgi:hypothetical protein